MDKILEKYGVRVDKEKKSKHKKKTKTTKKFIGSGLKIVDSDDGMTVSYGSKPMLKNVVEDDDDGMEVDELPQIVDVVDERPVEVRLLEEFRKTNKWKTVAADSEIERSKSPDKNKARISTKNDSKTSPPRTNSQRSPNSRNKGSSHRMRCDRSDRDPSPSQRGRKNRSDSDPSPPRRGRRNRSDSDPSPPRRGRRNRSDSDPSPPRRGRRNRTDSDPSPPRRGRRNGSDSDPSPPRRHQKSVVGPSDGKEKMTKTLDGKRAGLQVADNLRNELQSLRQQEQEKFSQMDDELTGRYAKTRYRDRETGALRDFAAEKAKKDEEDAKAAARKAQYDKWGKGVKQIEQQETRVQEALHEIAKPLARYEDDKDLDAHLKSLDREGDPMLKFLSKKRAKAASAGPAKPTYQGPPPPPNRFGILPGYRWDGVDRSNGYEKQFFQRINSKKALLEESYKWSVEDL